MKALVHSTEAVWSSSAEAVEMHGKAVHGKVFVLTDFTSATGDHAQQAMLFNYRASRILDGQTHSTLRVQVVHTFYSS